MAYADEVFKKMCRDIIDNGTDTRGEKVRGGPVEGLKEGLAEEAVELRPREKVEEEV